MNPLEKFLPRLKNVTEQSAGRFRASCPTAGHLHGDRSRGLYVTETEDRRLLIKCFAGCDVASIVDSVGLALRDLFPINCEEHRTPTKQRWNHREVLQVARHEIYVVSIGLDRLLNGAALIDDEIERLRNSADRLRGILEVANV